MPETHSSRKHSPIFSVEIKLSQGQNIKAQSRNTSSRTKSYGISDFLVSKARIKTSAREVEVLPDFPWLLPYTQFPGPETIAHVPNLAVLVFVWPTG